MFLGERSKICDLGPATARARAVSAPKPLDAPVMTITLLTILPPLLTCDVWG
jgi:hypothetical protein